MYSDGIQRVSGIYAELVSQSQWEQHCSWSNHRKDADGIEEIKKFAPKLVNFFNMEKKYFEKTGTLIQSDLLKMEDGDKENENKNQSKSEDGKYSLFVWDFTN